MIFVTIKNMDGIAIQNKVSLKCDNEKENIHEVAENFFRDVCDMDGLDPTFFTYEVFIKDNNNFYQITKEETKVTHIEKTLIKKLPLKAAILEAKKRGIYKGISSDCIDGTFIVVGEKDYTWDGNLKHAIDTGNYIAFRDYIPMKELNALLEENT